MKELNKLEKLGITLQIILLIGFLIGLGYYLIVSSTFKTFGTNLNLLGTWTGLLHLFIFLLGIWTLSIIYGKIVFKICRLDNELDKKIKKIKKKYWKNVKKMKKEITKLKLEHQLKELK